MKLLTPELVYHNVEPIYSCDIQPKSNDFIRLATGGMDNAVRLWKLPLKKPSEKVQFTIELVASLCRHEKVVNVVRWSPSGKIIASASSDGVIILWEKVEGKHDTDDNEVSLEVWSPRFLRRHIEDINDICWSSDDNHIISGSIDCSAILWNVTNNKCLMLKDHKQFVQGVAWDPMENFVVTQSTDRTFRVYRSTSRNCIYKVWKAGDVKLFQDGSWKYFFRRLQFSPDGKLLITPAGAYNIQKENATGDQYPLLASSNDDHCAHIFVRNNLSKVAVTIPTGKNPVIGVRFNPLKFTLRKKEQPVFNLPYRWIFCLILDNAVLIFDTEQSLPIAKISNMHFLTINDASWSPDGHCLVICSTDGYCSYLYFDKGDLGEPFKLATRPSNVRYNDFEDVGGECDKVKGGENVGLMVREPIQIIDMAMDSTEMLVTEDHEEPSSSDTAECLAEPQQQIVCPVSESTVAAAPIKRPSIMITTETTMEPKDKKRRLTLMTLT